MLLNDLCKTRYKPLLSQKSSFLGLSVLQSHSVLRDFREYPVVYENICDKPYVSLALEFMKYCHKCSGGDFFLGYVHIILMFT